MRLPLIKTKRSKCPHCGGPVKVADPDSLRARREAAGLSLREFAKIEPVFSAAYISDVERGRRGATAQMVRRYQGLGR